MHSKRRTWLILIFGLSLCLLLGFRPQPGAASSSLPLHQTDYDFDHRPSGVSPQAWKRILQQVQGESLSLPADPQLTWPVKKVVAGDGAASDGAGISVAIFGDILVVGAYNDEVGGNLQRGSAYIFARNQGGAPNFWGNVTKIVASDGAAYDYFGISVAIYGDTIVVGAPGAAISGRDNQGAAYVFRRNQGGADQWGQVKKLVASDGLGGNWFGDAVAISQGTILVGADWADGAYIRQGAAYIFSRNQGGADNWGQVKKLVASDAAAYNYFGAAVAISGGTAVVGAWGADVSGTLGQGSAYIFTRNQGGADNWGQVKKIAAADGAAYERFGYAVAINDQADSVVVGAYHASVSGASQRGAAYLFTRNQGGSPDNWGQMAKLVAADGAANDFFGRSVAIQGDMVLVGASGDDSSRGAAYRFARNQGGANAWGQVEKLVAADGAASDNFGIAVAVNQEADTFVVGAPGDDSWRGSAYVFTRQGNNWTQEKKVTASDGASSDYFGLGLALAGDILVVGSSYDDNDKGAVYIYARNWGGADNWGQVKKLTASDGVAYDNFGRSVALSGDTLVVGAPSADISSNVNQGAAYIFARNWGGADNWGQVKKLVASDGATNNWFGDSVAISGDTLLVGAYGAEPTYSYQGAAYIFSRNQGGADNWGQVKKLVASDAADTNYFGTAVAISSDTLVVGATGADIGSNDNQGAAYVFTRNWGGADNWGQVKKLVASDGSAHDFIGTSVAISGDTLVVGSVGADAGSTEYYGAAYVFTRNQGGADQWGQVRKLVASDEDGDEFGRSVAISGDTLVVGAAYFADYPGGYVAQGTAYVFCRNQGGLNNWGKVKKLTALDGQLGDIFGRSVAISGEFIAAGAPFDDSYRGSAYIFREVPNTYHLPVVFKDY